MKKVYRVYFAFHDPSESGTREFGIFSTKEQADAVVARAQSKFPPDPFGDGGYVHVREYLLDEEISSRAVGYT